MRDDWLTKVFSSETRDRRESLCIGMNNDELLGYNVFHSQDVRRMFKDGEVGLPWWSSG